MALVVGGVAVLLVVVAAASVFRLTERGDGANAWPVGTPITATDALTLDQAEEESFDTALLGSPAAAPKHPLEHLPPIPGDGHQILWQTSQEVLLPTKSDHIVQMIRCMGRASCDAEEIERLGRSALPVLGNPTTSGGPCGYEPKTTDADKRVPFVMLAIAMAWAGTRTVARIHRDRTPPRAPSRCSRSTATMSTGAASRRNRRRWA
jgi:hypothetical protein